MKVARNTTHNLRHDWLRFTDKGVNVSLLAHRQEIHVEVTVDGVTSVDYFTPRQLATIILREALQRPDAKPPASAGQGA